MHRASVSYRPITAHLRRGDLIAYPTESSYGPGCDPDNRDAVLRLLKLKHRPQHESLILIASSYQQVARCPQPLTSTQQQQLSEAGAQAITCLMPVHQSAPGWSRPARISTGSVRPGLTQITSACSGARCGCYRGVSARANNLSRSAYGRMVKSYAVKPIGEHMSNT